MEVAPGLSSLRLLPAVERKAQGVGVGWGEAFHTYLLPLFFSRKPGGANSQPLLQLEELPCRAQSGVRPWKAEHESGLAFSLPFALWKWSLTFLFFRTPCRKTANLKGNEMSCVPHGAWGIEIIKTMRFPGSSRCLRWVLI